MSAGVKWLDLTSEVFPNLSDSVNLQCRGPVGPVALKGLFKTCALYVSHKMPSWDHGFGTLGDTVQAPRPPFTAQTIPVQFTQVKLVIKPVMT